MPVTGTSVKEQIQVQIENGKNEREIMKIYTLICRHINTFGIVQTHDAKKQNDPV